MKVLKPDDFATSLALEAAILNDLHGECLQRGIEYY